MKSYHLLIGLAAIALLSCSKHTTPTKVTIKASNQAITAEMDAIQDTAYLNFLQPTKDSLDREMSVPIGTIDHDLYKNDSARTLVVWAANAIQKMACKRFTPKPHFSLINVGGVRTEVWKAPTVTVGYIYRLMPFDNKLALITLSGKDTQDLLQRCQSFGQKGLSDEVATLTIHPDSIYRIATSAYLCTEDKDGIIYAKQIIDYFEHEDKLRDIYFEYFGFTDYK